MEILWEEEGFQIGFKRWQGWERHTPTPTYFQEVQEVPVEKVNGDKSEGLEHRPPGSARRRHSSVNDRYQPPPGVSAILRAQGAPSRRRLEPPSVHGPWLPRGEILGKWLGGRADEFCRWTFWKGGELFFFFPLRGSGFSYRQANAPFALKVAEWVNCSSDVVS